MIPYNRALANKDGRENIALGVINQIKEGNIDPIDVLLNARKWKDVFELLEKNEVFRDLARTELAKYGGSNVEIGGNKITEGEVGVKYHYENTGDPIYAERLAAYKKAEAELKEREGFLKKVSKVGEQIVDPSTGEVVTIYPPYKTSTTTFKVTLQK